MWGGRHVQWAGSTYWAGVNGQARWANRQVGNKCVNGEGGWASVRCDSVCEIDMGEAKVVGGHCGAVWGCIVVTLVENIGGTSSSSLRWPGPCGMTRRGSNMSHSTHIPVTVH